MSNLREDLNHLLAVQEVDSRIDRVKAAIAALDSGSGVASAYNSGKAAFDELRTAAMKAQAEQRDAENRLASIESKSAEVTKKLYGGTVTASRELQNLQAELDMLARQKSEAEEQVLKAMEAASAAVTTARDREAELKALAERYRAIRAVYKERHAALTEELTRYQQERAAAVAPVPATLLSRYEAIRAKKGGIAAAAIGADDCCGACHTRLNSALIAAVSAAETPQVCEYCGRLLVPSSSVN